jgi:lipopolysaccharide biosynthesis glycosyltransferase
MVALQAEFAGSSVHSAAAEERMIEVLCASDERFLAHAATMLCSLLEHNPIIRIHFLHGSIPRSELLKLEALAANYGCEKIVFYDVRQVDFEDLRVDKWASIAVYYRLLAPRLLPDTIEKVLYLDSDLIVRKSLAPLWNTDIADRPLAAVPDYIGGTAGRDLGLPDGTKYFNSGVLLMNLQYWRRNSVAEQAISFIRHNPDKVQYWDQDALNANLANQWVELPTQWNWQDFDARGQDQEPAIVHFVSWDKPWRWSNKHPYKEEYHKYRLKTPWREYRQEGRPSPVRIVARAVLPARVRQWIRSRLAQFKA